MAHSYFTDRHPQLQEPIQLRRMTGEVYVTIEQKQGYVEARWSGHITASEMVCASKACLELIRTCGCSRLLHDKTAITGNWEDANDWLRYEWMPQAIAAGLRYMAHVYSRHMFCTLTARDLLERVWPALHMRNFYSRREAEDWLSGDSEKGPAGTLPATA